MRLQVPGRLRLWTRHTLTRALLAFFLIATLGLTTAWLPTPVGAEAIVVDTVADTIDATQEPSCGSIVIDDLPGGGDGKISLREAICAANNTDGDDVITFQSGLTGQVLLTHPDGELEITSNLTITGPGAGVLAIDGDDDHGVFAIYAGVVAISDLTIRDGLAERGAGVYNSSNLTITNAVITENVAVTSGESLGGGVFNGNEGTLALIDTTVSFNRADDGGGIANFNELTITGGTIADNTADQQGAGLYNEGMATIADTSIVRNSAADFGEGGGIYSSTFGVFATSPLSLARVVISGNEAYIGGGVAIESDTKRAELGAVAAASGATIESSTISENDACFGGGMWIDFEAVTIRNSTISGNAASDADDSQQGSLAELICIGEYPDEGNGGGIWSTGPLDIANSTISGNSADNEGGGLYLEGEVGTGEPTTIAYSTITGNTADANVDESVDGGGGIYYEYEYLVPAATPAALASGVQINSSIIAGNSGPAGAQDCDGTVESTGHNLVGADTGCPTDGTGDITTGNIAAVLNTTLANNGGPTQTHALVAGSAALDVADAATCTTTAASRDQRGMTRPAGAGCDIGAYELSTVVLVVLTVQTEGSGTVAASPAPLSSAGTAENMTYQYAPGTVVTLTATPASGQVFARWTIDGVGELPYGKGWASPLTITLDTAHTAKATFAARPSFTDVPTNHPSYTAITELTARGIIKGYTAQGCDELNTAVPCFGPDDQTQRAQSAAFLTRLLGFSNENHGTGGFIDLAGLDPELQRAVGTMAHYDIMIGYGDGRFGPNDKITYLQTALVISRAFVVKGYWAEAAADDPSIYPNLALSPGERIDLVTFVQNVGPLPGFANSTQRPALDQAAPRSWTAEALWLALDGHYGVDEPGKGGFVP